MIKKCRLLCVKTMMSVRPFCSIPAIRQLKSCFEITQKHLTKNEIYTIAFKPHFRSIATVREQYSKQAKLIHAKAFHVSSTTRRKKNPDKHEDFDEQNSLLYNGEFEKKQSKDKNSFLEVVRLYKENVKTTGGHVDFIKAALRYMREFGVHKDLTAYKSLLHVFPKGKYRATNIWLAEFMYFPRQQLVTMDLLYQMEVNGVEPDKELLVIMEQIFGRLSYPYKRVGNNLYWYTKLKKKSPFYSPSPLPKDALMLAKIAVERMTRVDLQTVISVYNTESVVESIDKTWIVSGQSPKQKELLAKHPPTQPVIVEGSELIWLKDTPINYFILRADCDPFPYHPEDKDDISQMEPMFFNPNYTKQKKSEQSVHEQDDGIIYAVCVTGTSSKDSLLSWVRILQSTGNPILADVPVLFKFTTPEELPVPFSDEVVKQDDNSTTNNINS